MCRILNEIDNYSYFQYESELAYVYLHLQRYSGIRLARRRELRNQKYPGSISADGGQAEMRDLPAARTDDHPQPETSRNLKYERACASKLRQSVWLIQNELLVNLQLPPRSATQHNSGFPSAQSSRIEPQAHQYALLRFEEFPSTGSLTQSPTHSRSTQCPA